MRRHGESLKSSSFPVVSTSRIVILYVYSNLSSYTLFNMLLWLTGARANIRPARRLGKVVGETEQSALKIPFLQHLFDRLRVSVGLDCGGDRPEAAQLLSLRVQKDWSVHQGWAYGGTSFIVTSQAAQMASPAQATADSWCCPALTLSPGSRFHILVWN